MGKIIGEKKKVVVSFKQEDINILNAKIEELNAEIKKISKKEKE